MRDQSLWTWHVATAVIILILLGLHMIIMHLDDIVGVLNPAGDHPIDWANVEARAGSAFFMVTYIIFLGAALFHGFYGFRNVLFELNPAKGLKVFITSVFEFILHLNFPQKAGWPVAGRLHPKDPMPRVSPGYGGGYATASARTPLAS